MARTAAMVAAEKAVTDSIFTYLTSTLPPLAVAAHNQALTDDPRYSVINTDDDMAFYAHCKTYLDRLIRAGRLAGPNPLPYR